ncbi:beta-hexosaminidase subunit beta [Galendromus occidentalis]|uniref:beta-N-acetylhexosaminidase n=1 Tax=Galendromus occidentalis TaxID=34638 RepID=A0AAJ7SGN8_9ACAR|nr:beta-hexosaminidase subunit beta [Galendromus occidentalis]
MKTLKQNLDAMAQNKFNVFHWHIVDDQSWPLQMEHFPNLTDAAYHPRLVYSQRDVAELVQYARLRGIRVIPEIDSPGHSQALGKVFPNILTPCYGTGGRGSADYPRFAAYEMLNPMNDYTYDVMREIIREVNRVFPDDYIHLGMDEVYYDCWRSSPEIKDFMRKRNMSSVSQVEQHYVKRTLDNVKKLGAKYMIWQDPIDNGVEAAPDTVVGVWKSGYAYSWQEYLITAARNGYKIVLSAPWYLNYISYGQDWEKYYTVEPLDFPASAKDKELVIGGEACMWGEYVDGTNAISRLWPRASAVGERLWSARNVKDVEEAKYRLDEHRCRMLRRNLPVQPILNGYCGGYDADA